MENIRKRQSHSLHPGKIPCPRCGAYLRVLTPREQDLVPLYLVSAAGSLFCAETALPDHALVSVCDACEKIRRHLV